MKRIIPAVVILTLLVGGTLLASRFPQAEFTMPPSDIIFAHANHVDLECIDCHADISQSDNAGDRNFPTMDLCADCHDIESDDNCGLCHRNPEEPGATPHPDRPIAFDHKRHLGQDIECAECHGDIAASTESSLAFMPQMQTCFVCHDGTKADDNCATCHQARLALADIHPTDWRHRHGDEATLNRDWCRQCHERKNTCLDCHRGDNLTGGIHDLNYMYTHGLDAQSKRLDCARCHDQRTFCNDCHERENLLPLLHSSVSWLTDHGRAARRDVENCASCHDTADPTCARAGCHLDADGIRGTDPRFHASSTTMFDSHGPFHNDDGYVCYQCHTNTRTPGQGFCGYCHR